MENMQLLVRLCALSAAVAVQQRTATAATASDQPMTERIYVTSVTAHHRRRTDRRPPPVAHGPRRLDQTIVHGPTHNPDKRELGNRQPRQYTPKLFWTSPNLRSHADNPRPTTPMLLHTPEARLVTLLRQCYRSPRCLTTTRALATSSPRQLRAGRLSYKAGSERSYTTGHTPDNVAVLGGGITGLIAAAMVARRNPNANVTLYE
ncbi:hypothetical protein O988_04363, partial [Pseudogymnoascus sp. VKM F-3808]